jgi:cell division protein FtsQ
VVGYPLPVQYDRVFSSIAVLKSFVDRSGYVPDDVVFDQEGNLTVTYGGVQVNLGKGDNIESRVAAIGKTLPSIAGLSGILHLENYDGTQNRFIFSKK